MLFLEKFKERTLQRSRTQKRRDYTGLSSLLNKGYVNYKRKVLTKILNLRVVSEWLMHSQVKVQYVYQELDRTFKRNILDAPRENSEPLTEEDLYWLDKDAIGLGEAREFLLTASTWIRRFEGDFTVVADVEAALSVKLLEAHPEAPQTDPVLLVDVRWYFLPDTIEELYSPLGLVICRGELLRGVFPKLLGEDLSLSGKKKFDRERTRKFLRDEWHLLRPLPQRKSSAEAAFCAAEMCIVQKNRSRVQFGGLT